MGRRVAAWGWATRGTVGSDAAWRNIAIRWWHSTVGWTVWTYVWIHAWRRTTGTAHWGTTRTTLTWGSHLVRWWHTLTHWRVHRTRLIWISLKRSKNKISYVHVLTLRLSARGLLLFSLHRIHSQFFCEFTVIDRRCCNTTKLL